MGKRILITGGAGFIGSHLADELLTRGYDVRVLDNLSSQVHGHERKWPPYLNSEAELMIGDVEDADALAKAVRGVDAVFHLAAMVGAGQSMYEIRRYTSANNVGTATLMELLSRNSVERLVIASSMSVYGEGSYKTSSGETVCAAERSLEQLRKAEWELFGPDGRQLIPVPTPENKTPSLASVYALSKYDQEILCLMLGAAYEIPAVALRFFNVFGERQALSNPYTGVAAIFASRLLNDRPPLIFEDGEQTRDFIDVRDVARACLAAITSEGADGRTLNIGTGIPTSVLGVASVIAAGLSKDVEPEVVNQYRAGDIRHCYADTRLAEELLGFRAEIPFELGMEDLLAWLEGQEASDTVDAARDALVARGLAR